MRNAKSYKPHHPNPMSKSSYKNTKAKAATIADATSRNVMKKHCVQHNYHDHASDKIDETFKIEYNQEVSNEKGVAIPFPIKLHNMLEHIESIEPDLSHIISWQPHGRCFIVHKPKLFSEHPQGLVRFFQQKKYASFQRQLNLYGFNRITKGPDRGSYYHELFLRGKSFLCQGIKRTKVKGTGRRMASNPDAEPDFYEMEPMSPTSTTRTFHHHSVITEEENEPMPPLPVVGFTFSSSTVNPPDNQQEELEYVFENMPFHGINQNGSRRHSLTIQRRNSLIAQLQSSANSLVTPNTSENDLNNAQAFQASQSRSEDEEFSIIERV